MNKNKNFFNFIIAFVVILPLFINKIKAEEMIHFSSNEKKIIDRSDYYSSKNEIILAEQNYIIVGNLDKDFKSIKFFSNKYCSTINGKSYHSSTIKISPSVSYNYCLKIDELDQFNLSEEEISCLHKSNAFIDTLFVRDCDNMINNFEDILSAIKNYRQKINFLSSDHFIYEILTTKITEDIESFENKVLLLQSTKLLTMELLEAELPMKKKLKLQVIKRHKNLCILYGFIEGSDYYNDCILILLRNEITKVSVFK